jgi:hypothetical protein
MSDSRCLRQRIASIGVLPAATFDNYLAHPILQPAPLGDLRAGGHGYFKQNKHLLSLSLLTAAAGQRGQPK